MVNEGDMAPDFRLPGTDGQTHTLATLRGRPVVLYFYPRDSTPGCTAEACAFRDNMERVGASGAIVLGVSKDSLQSHERFRDAHGLPFVLLSDEQQETHKAYGTWGEKKLYGKVSEGTIRSTFLINEAGKVARVWRKVRVRGHVDKVLEALEGLVV